MEVITFSRVFLTRP